MHRWPNCTGGQVAQVGDAEVVALHRSAMPRRSHCTGRRCRAVALHRSAMPRRSHCTGRRCQGGCIAHVGDAKVVALHMSAMPRSRRVFGRGFSCCSGKEEKKGEGKPGYNYRGHNYVGHKYIGHHSGEEKRKGEGNQSAGDARRRCSAPRRVQRRTRWPYSTGGHIALATS